ncbi:MAG TPA: histone deacetylase [Methanomicrobiales archaeon]|nr:histone deacetylase [Methanomicrobiales archaeon]
MPGCSVITSDLFSAHDMPGHPESQARLLGALSGVPPGIRRYPPEKALLEDLYRVHTPEYVNMLGEACRRTRTFTMLDPDTYITRDSFDVAILAAGGAIGAAERALEGEHCFALVRPPGHHAERDRAMGFCLLNNVAIAAARALATVDRVAIVDWDIHHGNGTQQAFYDSDRVLYCSIHRGHYYPYSGRTDERGSGAGEGFTLNAPLAPGATIADYDAVFAEAFVSAIRKFRPNLLLVSAGQDVLSDDPLGGMDLYPSDLGLLTWRLLKAVSGLPIALVLEGGYGPSHGAAIGEIFRVLGGGNPKMIGGEPGDETLRVIGALKG